MTMVPLPGSSCVHLREENSREIIQATQERNRHRNSEEGRKVFIRTETSQDPSSPQTSGRMPVSEELCCCCCCWFCSCDVVVVVDFIAGFLICNIYLENFSPINCL